jgi:hypothetical protein
VLFSYFDCSGSLGGVVCDVCRMKSDRIDKIVGDSARVAE